MFHGELLKKLPVSGASDKIPIRGMVGLSVLSRNMGGGANFYRLPCLLLTVALKQPKTDNENPHNRYHEWEVQVHDCSIT